MESGSGLMWTSVTCFVSCTWNLALLKPAAKLPLILRDLISIPSTFICITFSSCTFTYYFWCVGMEDMWNILIWWTTPYHYGEGGQMPLWEDTFRVLPGTLKCFSFFPTYLASVLQVKLVHEWQVFLFWVFYVLFCCLGTKIAKHSF